MIGYQRKLARVLDVMGGLYLVDDLLTAIAEGQDAELRRSAIRGR